MSFRLFALVLILFVAAACGGSSPTTADSVSEPVSEQDVNNPTIAKEKFETRIEEDLEKITPKLQEEQRQGDYTYHAEAIGTYSYDIQQSDSIVSPFLGIAEYDIRWYANNEHVSDLTIQAQYAYQDGDWVLKEALRSIDGKLDKDPASVGGPT